MNHKTKKYTIMGKELKGFSLDNTNRKYLDEVVIKGLSYTLNMLITKCRELNLSVNFSRKFENLDSSTSANLDVENIEFINSIQVSSFSFTLNCLIQTAKEQGIKP